MARALLVFLGLVALAAAGAWLADHPGLVSVQWGGRRIETDTAVAVAAVLVLIFVVAFLARFWRWLMTSPMALATLRAEGRRRKGYQALSRGLVAVAAGDVGQAKKLARRTADLLDDPPLTLLLSAQAAQLDGDEGAARDYFAAMREQPETEFLGLRGLLVQARRAGDGAEALRLARRAFELRPDTPWVLQELFGLEAAAGNWPAARKLVDQAAKRKLLDGAAADRRRALVLFAQALAAEAQGETKRALELARKAHGLAADFVPATAMAGRLHGAANDGRKARRLLREGWQRLPHPELLAAWRSLDPQQQPAARLQAVRELTADNPGHEESRVALAEAAIAAGQWDLARDQLQALMDGAPSVRVGRLFADLEEAESGDAAAGREWLRRAAALPADAGWLCQTCGRQNGEWAPHCPDCASFDAFAWRRPAGSGAVLPYQPPEPPAEEILPPDVEPPPELTSNELPAEITIEPPDDSDLEIRAEGKRT